MSFNITSYDDVIEHDLSNIVSLLKRLGVIPNVQLLYHIYAETYTSATDVAARRYYLSHIKKSGVW